MMEFQSAEDDGEEIVMTPLKPKQGRQVIRIERTTTEKLNSDRVHYVAGGNYMGIIVNRAVSVKPKKSPPHAIRHFLAHVNTHNNEVLREVRELRFWFKGKLAKELSDAMAEDFFKELMNPTNFPKDYISFVKRLLRLVQSFISIRTMELEIRPFADGDEVLDVRGQPMGITSTSSTLVRSSRSYSMERAIGEQPIAVDDLQATDSIGLSPRLMNDKEDLPVATGNETTGDSESLTTKKNEKKRKSRPVSDGFALTTPVKDAAVPKRKSRPVSDDVAMTSLLTATDEVRNERTGATLEEFDEVEQIVKLRHEPRRGGSEPRRSGHKRKSRAASDELAVTSLPTASAAAPSNGTAGDDVNGCVDEVVHEEVIQVQLVEKTGYRGNPSYAAELELRSLSVEDNDEVEQIVELRHEPRRGGSGPRESLSTNRVSSAGNLAHKREKVIGALEDAFPNALTIDDIIRLTHVKESDAEVLIADLSRVNAVSEIELGMWIRTHQGSHPLADSMSFNEKSSRKSKRASTKLLNEQNPRHHDFRLVAHIPVLKSSEQPTIAIVTSLYCEKLAVDAMIDYKTTYMRCKKGGEGQVYTVGKIGKHRVVSTKLSRVTSSSGTSVAAGNTITRLLGTFGRIEHALLVGVAGGVASADDDSIHVRLGDVIVSLSDGVRPVYSQTNGEPCQESESHRASRNGDGGSQTWTATDPYLNEVFMKLKRAPKSFYKRLDQFISEGLQELEPCSDEVDASVIAQIDRPPSIFARPPSETDHPYVRVGTSEIELPNSGHPPVQVGSIRDRRGPNRPVVHSGVVGAGRALVRDPEARQRASNELGIRAVDVGFRAVLDSIVGNRKESFGVVRGAADYADGGGAKGHRAWRPYAALAAAATMKCVIMAIPAPADDDELDI